MPTRSAGERSNARPRQPTPYARTSFRLKDMRQVNMQPRSVHAVWWWQVKAGRRTRQITQVAVPNRAMKKVCDDAGDAKRCEECMNGAHNAALCQPSKGRHARAGASAACPFIQIKPTETIICMSCQTEGIQRRTKTNTEYAGRVRHV